MRKQLESSEFELGPAEVGLQGPLLVDLPGQLGVDLTVEAAQAPVTPPHKAQTLARAALAQGQRVRVTLRSGVYKLDSTLVFTPSDSGTADAPVVWEASPGGEVAARRAADVSACLEREKLIDRSCANLVTHHA